MFFEKNKHILIGAVAILLVWAGVYFFVIEANRALADDNENKAKANADSVKAAANNAGESKLSKEKQAQIIPRKKADEALAENNAALDARFKELKRIEFGTPDALRPFSEAAAGVNDPKNYLSIEIQQTVDRAKANSIAVPPGLNILEKAGDDPVPLSLMHVAMADRFILACKTASVPQIVKFQYIAPQPISVPEPEAVEEDEKADKAAEKPRGVKAKDKDKEKEALEKEARVERLIQFPMKVMVKTPERFFGQLLYELQRPSDASHGYFTQGGFHVTVRDTGSGMIEASVAVAALLKESDVKALNIPFKDKDAENPNAGAPKKVIEY